MKYLERIPTGWLLTGAGLACLLLWAGPGWAQAQFTPAQGTAAPAHSSPITGGAANTTARPS